MSYTPFNWLARIGQGLNIFTDARTGQVLELNSTPTSVEQEGTPFSVERMNALEQGLANVYDKDEQMASTIPPLYGLSTGAVPSDLFQILAQAALYKSLTPSQEIGTISTGQTVWLNENGVPTEFYVAEQNYESGLNGSGRTLLVRKSPLDARTWDSGNVNAYASSDIDAFLNGDYKELFDSNVQSELGTTSFYYTPGNGTSSVSTLSRSIFLLSVTEYGLSSSSANVEGSSLPIASTLRGTASASRWTRSPGNPSSDNSLVCVINTSGGFAGSQANNSCIFHPAFTLPSSFVAYTEQPSGALYDVLGNILLKLPGVQIAIGSYVGTGTYGASNPNSLTFEFEPQFVLIFLKNVPSGKSSVTNFAVSPLFPISGQLDAVDRATPFTQESVKWSNGNKTVSWYAYNSSAESQFNASGYRYCYIAIG